MKKLLFLLSLLTSTYSALAQQTGTLTGKVTDKKTNEAVIGAVVFITGSSKGTATDENGMYSLKVEEGIYKIAVSYVSYKPLNLENIRIEAGKTTTLNIGIEENASMLNAVTIVGTRQTNTEMSMITEMRKGEVVANGVSGEQIAKSLDRDAAETVKRIPGITIMDNRFIVIRGMNERYNTVMLNDALTPSTETDAKAFSFDILPTSVIDRIMIYKGGSPELPGEFAGGVIKVYTKNFADDNTTNFSLSSSYRGNSTFQDFNSYQGSKTDFLGFDNGKRSLPGSFPTSFETLNNSQKADLGKALENTWLPQQKSAAPDLRMSLGLTRRFTVGGVKISNLSAVSYSNTRQTVAATRNKYSAFIPELAKSDTNYAYNDLQSSENVRLGVIHNWSARLNNNHKLEFRNLFNQLGANQVTIREGIEKSGNQVDQKNYALRYESRRIYSGQLHGTHDILNENATVTWTAGYANTNRNEPDYRRLVTQRERYTTDPFVVVIPNSASPKYASRFYSTMQEQTLMGSADLEYRLGKKDSVATEDKRVKLRTGFYTETKNRDFSARFFSYTNRSTQFDNNLINQPLGQIFKPENINHQTGFVLDEGTTYSDTYTASNHLAAGYLSASIPVTNRLAVAGGARLEYNRQQLESADTGGKPIVVDNPVTRLLPSVNVSFNLTENQLLRASASMSLNRPEFREIAPFTYYDFNTNFEIQGEPNLKTPTIYNTDLRYEWYPTATEVVSFGGFYKHFINPIENYFVNTSGGNTYSFQNAEKAMSYGVETEIRKSFLGLSENKFVQNLSVVLNASLIKSEVEMSDAAVGQDKRRPMMGQSPYIINTGIYYQNSDKNLQVNLLYNIIGKRIFIVGNKFNPTIYEMPRHQLDLTVTKGFGERFEIKAGVQDLLNQQYRMIQDSDNNAKINSTDESIMSYRRGTYSTIGFNYKF